MQGCNSCGVFYICVLLCLNSTSVSYVFMILKGNAPVASVYAGESCVQLKGAEIIAQLYHYLRLVTLCMLFSKKPFPVFLESAGYSQEDVLLQKPKAGVCNCITTTLLFGFISQLYSSVLIVKTKILKFLFAAS